MTHFSRHAWSLYFLVGLVLCFGSIESAHSKSKGEVLLNNNSSGGGSDDLVMEPAALGKPFQLKFTSYDGKIVDTSQMRGKVILIDFWASWCGPCREFAPTVKALYDQYHNSGLEVIGINLDTNSQAFNTFVSMEKLTWPHYYDGRSWDNKISRNYNVNSIPRVWLINKKGELASTDAWMDTQRMVAALMAEDGPAPMKITPQRAPSVNFRSESDQELSLERFQALYTLMDSEPLKYIPYGTYPKEKAAYFLYRDSVIPQQEVTAVWKVNGKDITPGMSNSMGLPIRFVYYGLKNGNASDIQGNPDLLKLNFKGDLLINQKASIQEIAPALQQFISFELKKPVKVTVKQETTAAYILQGRFQYNPMVTSQDSTVIKTPYRMILYKNRTRPEWLETTFPDYLNRLANVQRIRIINEATGIPAETMLMELPDYYQKQNTIAFLELLAKQTGLTFKEETKEFSVLVIEEK